MPGSLSSRIVVLASLAAAVVGVVDALAGGDGDLVAVFAIIGMLQVWLLVRSLLGRRTVTLRRDLADWLDEEGAVTGEPASRIADRCVSVQRTALRRR